MYYRVVLLLSLTFCAVTASATTSRMLTDEDLIISSRLVLRGQVTALECLSDERGEIYTYVTVKVDRFFKGRLKTSRIVFRQLGGRIGDDWSVVAGAPSYRVGEQVLLFLETAGDGALRIAHLFQGKFSIERDMLGREVVRRTVENVHILEVTPDSERVTSYALLSSFIRRIDRTLKLRREQVEQYERMHSLQPLLSQPPEYGRSIAVQFTLLGSPLPGRWHQADDGTPVTYFVNPENAPVVGGGTVETDAALAAWTAVASASITLQRAGASTSCGFTNTDGVNTISFGDCRNEISDLVNCSGTLAVARFRSSSQERTINGQRFFLITDADIVFNNGICNPTSSFIAETMTHEVGHTIGLGHSSENTSETNQTLRDATMFFRIHNDGRGASLRSDDISGVSFIYPTAQQGASVVLTVNGNATIAPGQSASLPVTLQRINFTGAVQLGLSLQGGQTPAGLTFSYSSNPTTSSNVTLNINTTAATPVGTYTFVATGTATGATVTNSPPFTIQVESSPPDFTLSISPQTQTVAAGASAPYTLSISTSNGFSSFVNLSFQNLPLGATVPPFQGSSPIPFQIVTDSSTPSGTYLFTVVGSGGGLTRTATATLIVQQGSVTISVGLQSQSVNQGGSASYPVTLQRSNFTGSIQMDLSVVGIQPAGLTFSYSANPVTGASVTLTISTTAATPAGTYTFVATGTATGAIVNSSAQFTLVVQPQSGFTLAITPASQTVTAGETASYNLLVEFTGGFSSPLSFSFQNLPSGATVPPFQGSSPIMFQIVTATSTPANTYTFIVTATGGGITKMATAQLVVTAQPSVNLRVEKTIETINAGQVASYPVTILRNNFTGAVELSLAVLGSVPAGLTFAYSSNPTTETTVTLLLSASNVTPAGTYSFVATGKATGAIVNESAPFTLVVLEQPKLPTITSASYSKPILTIEGAEFKGSLRVSVNGADVTQRITGSNASTITLKGNKKKLNLRSGVNQIVVSADGRASNTFTFNLGFELEGRQPAP